MIAERLLAGASVARAYRLAARMLVIAVIMGCCTVAFILLDLAAGAIIWATLTAWFAHERGAVLGWAAAHQPADPPG